jgi:hypothetical protein
MVGNKLNPEAHARHLIRPPPTRGIATKVTQAPSTSHNAPVLPGFAAVSSTPLKHSARINNIDFSAVCLCTCVVCIDICLRVYGVVCPSISVFI